MVGLPAMGFLCLPCMGINLVVKVHYEYSSGQEGLNR